MSLPFGIAWGNHMDRDVYSLHLYEVPSYISSSVINFLHYNTILYSVQLHGSQWTSHNLSYNINSTNNIYCNNFGQFG
jgi:hypothetical protein